MKYITLVLLCCASFFANAQDPETVEISEDSLKILTEQYVKAMDSINQTFTYERGTVDLANGIATLEVPEGFKFLDAEQSAYVLTDLWGNPPSETLGLLFPEDMTPMEENFSFCVDISYAEEGYIKDEEAEDMDYDDLLEQMQDDIEAANPQREAQGYEPYTLVGWASSPYYDAQTKKLHWAKELSFEGYDTNTLNYDIRILGRRGYLNLNAIGDITVLEAFNNDRDKILESVEFTDGNRYADFNPDIDKVAAYGIGGLIAGKILTKVGFFAGLLKFWKFIAIGAVALFSGFRKRIFGGGSKGDA